MRLSRFYKLNEAMVVRLGSVLIKFVQFCFKRKGKEQVLTMKDMPRHIQIVKAPLIFFSFETLWARQIFASVSSNVLTLAMARLCDVFTYIYQKFASCRMDEFYEYAA